MARIEELEMEAHRAQLNSDLRRLVDKYRAIFGWDVPEVDEALSERLIIDSLRRALDDMEPPAGERAPAADDRPRHAVSGPSR